MEKKRTRKERFTDYLYYLAMGALVVWYAYTKGWIFADFESVDAEKALQMLRNDTNLTVVDVRTPKEYASGHLKGALSFPLENMDTTLERLEPYKTTTLLVYCRSGNRSVAASRMLKKHGFTPVNVKGGIVALVDAGAPIAK